VDSLVQTVSGLVVVNEKLVGLLTQAFGLGGEGGRKAVNVGNGETGYVR
jgi:hypothetical protein